MNKYKEIDKNYVGTLSGGSKPDGLGGGIIAMKLVVKTKITDTRLKKNWEKRFDKRFTRTDLSTGELEDRWFVRETTSKKLKDFFHQELDRKEKEIITAIKKALPTHKGKMLSRSEVKKMLDSLKGVKK